MLPKNKKTYFMLMLLLCITMLVGCWDRREIEDNIFILGVGIDNAEDDKIKVTFELALPQAFGGGEDSSNAESTLSITVDAKDMTDATSGLLKRIDRYPIYSHLQLVIFGEEFARKGIERTIDFFFRNPDVRYTTNVAVAVGEAKEILEFKPKTAKAASIYISDIISQNSNSSFEIFRLQSIGTIHENYIRESPIALSQIRIGTDSIDVSGTGVFKDYRLVGWFNGKEVQGERWIWGDMKRRGFLRVEMPQSQGGMVTLNVFNSDSSLTPILDDDNIIAECKIVIEGDITNIENPDIHHNIKELITQCERAFEDDIRKITHDAFIKGRDVFEVDVFEIDQEIADYYPKYWEEHRYEWDELFKTVELKVDVDVKIRRVGSF